jgi:flagellar protein FlgJ
MKISMLGNPPAVLQNASASTKAAKKFEAMVIGAMLTPMFKTIDKASAPFGGGSVEKEFQPFFISAVAKAMEARGGLGLGPEIQSAMAAKSGAGKS